MKRTPKQMAHYNAEACSEYRAYLKDNKLVDHDYTIKQNKEVYKVLELICKKHEVNLSHIVSIIYEDASIDYIFNGGQSPYSYTYIGTDINGKESEYSSRELMEEYGNGYSNIIKSANNKKGHHVAFDQTWIKTIKNS